MSESPKKLAEKHKDFDFEKHYRQEHRPRMRTRLLALHHLTQGMTQEDAAAAALCNEVSIRRWIRAFDEKGLAGLEENSGRGRKRKLPESSEKSDTAPIFSWSFLCCRNIHLYNDNSWQTLRNYVKNAMVVAS